MKNNKISSDHNFFFRGIPSGSTIRCYREIHTFIVFGYHKTVFIKFEYSFQPDFNGYISIKITFYFMKVIHKCIKIYEIFVSINLKMPGILFF